MKNFATCIGILVVSFVLLSSIFYTTLFVSGYIITHVMEPGIFEQYEQSPYVSNEETLSAVGTGSWWLHPVIVYNVVLSIIATAYIMKFRSRKRANRIPFARYR